MVDAADAAAPDAPEGVVYVPAGPFLMGSDDSECLWDSPMHEVWLSAYFIDVFEVTNAHYGACVLAGACAPPFLGSSRTRPVYFGAGEFGDFPVIEMAEHWANGDAYCRWAGKRLPTEAEWEKAARGGCELRGDPAVCEPDVDAPAWSWGDRDATCSDANVFVTCHDGDTAPVGFFSGDRGPYGTFDMMGNVTEVVSDWFVPDYYEWSPSVDPWGPSDGEAIGGCPGLPEVGACHAVRGGSFGGDPPPASSSDDALPCRHPNRFSWPDTGVRCAADAP